MMKQAVEDRAGGRDIAEQFAPFFDSTRSGMKRCEQHVPPGISWPWGSGRFHRTVFLVPVLSLLSEPVGHFVRCGSLAVDRK